MRPGSLARAVLPVLATSLLATRGEAQFSPGPLSHAHASLEGSAHCLSCHARERQIDPAKCFACHAVLRDRVAAGSGLHARDDYRDCRTCHMEHQGVGFELVFWGEAGRGGFDHAMTGHLLAGRHAQARCESCHRESHNRQAERLRAEGFTASRSFLGLDTVCASCHADPHRGQFARRSCDACHGQVEWRPASGYDHAETGYPLTGRHAGVACERCHAPGQSAEGPARVVFAALSSRACASCHEDVHGGRFGGTCETCHTTRGWQSYDRARFDHDRTRYPLQGRHAAVGCADCHPPGRPHRRPFERCTRCHADSHRGQLARRVDAGACESCHDVFGFQPARFDVADHEQTPYALEGAHLAVPCNACHPRASAAALGPVPDLGPPPAGRPVPLTRLRFASTRCSDCHRDPHAGAADRFMAQRGCQACHTVESWSAPGSYDHAQARYALVGKHAEASCGACHAKEGSVEPRTRVVFTGLTTGCQACHADPHLGQLARPGDAAPCERCHTPRGWPSLLFDHGRDSVYPLEGAHLRVECRACHRRVERDGVSVVRYKPLTTTCKGCHGTAPLRALGGTK